MNEVDPERAETTDGPPETEHTAVLAFLQVLGRIIRLYKLYPPSHPTVQEGVTEALNLYGEAMAQGREVTLGQVDGVLLVDDQPVSRVSPQVADFLGLLREKEVQSLVLKPGAGPDEVLSFARLLGLRNDAEPPEELPFKSFAQIPHIAVNKITYRKVSATQKVVEKEEQGESPRAVRKAPERRRESGGYDLRSQLINELVNAPPSELSEAIHAASAKAEGVEDISARTGGPLTKGSKAATRMLEQAAIGVVRAGGGTDQILDKFDGVLASLPTELANKLTGGAEASEAPARLLKRFGLGARSAVLARLLHNEPLLEELAASAELLTAEGEDPSALYERTALQFLKEGLAFPDASPFLLDLMELDRRFRKREIIETAKKKESPKFFQSRELPLVVVADTADYHEFYRTLLGSAYRAAFFEDGEAALEAILRDNPELVILDVKLPGMHGLDLIRRLRRQNRTPPLLIVSGQTSMAQDFEVKTYPHLRFLKKPPAEEVVKKAIGDLLKKGPEPASGEEEVEEPRALPPAVLRYLEKTLQAATPRIPGFDLSARMHVGPGTEALTMDSFHLYGGKRGVFLAGTSGEDADAVIVLRLFQTALKCVSPWIPTGRGALVQAAGFLGGDGIIKTPVAAQTLAIDPERGKVTLCTAGAPPPLRFLADRKKVRRVGSGGVAVGRLMRGGMGKVLEEVLVKIEPGDLVILTSWGLLKAKDAQGRTFGPESVGGLLLTAHDSNPASVTTRILQGVMRHVGENSPPSLGTIALRKSP